MNKPDAAGKFIKLLEIVEKLRGPDGCPWDKEQTHASLLPYFIEEAYEVMESVDEGDFETFQEELGDILLHVALQSQIASEDSKFNISDSLDTVNENWSDATRTFLGIKKPMLPLKPNKIGKLQNM